MKRKRHTIGAPHQCLDPKKAYTFFFSDHLQDEDKVIDEVSQVLSTKLRCKVSLFLNEKVDVMVDSKRNTSAFRIGSFSSGERVSSPGGNNKESYSSSSFDGNQLQKQRATSQGQDQTQSSCQSRNFKRNLASREITISTRN